MQVISLSALVVCFAFVKSTAYKDDGNDVAIVRGEKDRFTRKIACNESKAVCFNESCTYCQCAEGQTFARSRGYYGECVSNELLVYATSGYFLLDNYPHQLCLAYKHGGEVDSYFVYKSKSCNRENWKERWIWTKHKQLLNWESLECMTDDFTVTTDNTHFVRMKKCDRTDQKQLWECERKNSNEFIRQTQSGRYMHYGEHGKYVTTSSIKWDVAPQWARFLSGEQVCSQAVGCETFADGSSIILLNKTKCEENLNYSGEKEIELRKTSCSLLPHKFQYLHNDTWKPLEMKNGSFAITTMDKVSLQWNLWKTPKSWRGLLVKVQFKCEDTPGSNNDTEHCVVVKYTGTFEGFNDNDDGGDNDCDDDGGSDDHPYRNYGREYEDNANDVEIFRGEKDTFAKKLSCDDSKAVCLNESCTYCQCTEGQTFVRSRGYYGECVSNELLVYATSDGAYFLVENYPSQRCLYYRGSNRVDLVRNGKCNHNDGTYYWIWTNNGKLLNWNSLKCMTNDHTTAINIHFVTMKKCDESNQKQAWRCETIHNENYIQPKQSNRYMYYGDYWKYVTTKTIHWQSALKLRRFGTTQDVCSQAVGCETFADGSSIIILNNTECEEKSEYLGEKSEYSGEKGIDLRKTSCSLLPHQSEYLHNDTWKPLEMKNGSFSIKTMDKVSLQWNLRKTPKSWGGLLVKVQFKCEDTPAATLHCAVIKYTGNFKDFHGKDGGTYCDGEKGGSGDGKDEDGDDKDDDSDKNGDGNDKETDKDKINVNQESNGDDKDYTKTIIIIVCVLVVLILAGVAVFIMYRYRNRFFRSKESKPEAQDEAVNGDYDTTMNPLYPVNDTLSGQRECDLYEPASDHVYQYVDAADRKNVDSTPQNPTYDYAIPDGPLTSQEQEKPTTTQLPHKYHVLEGP